ncbi:MAG: cation-translocating P-type ATPase [Gemmatimonadetes bacterium]|nr:cation-translocating P-type ATPase [Gemmatimonadota bacterium]
MIQANDMTGLSEQEAAERLRAEGLNELPGSRSRSSFRIALEVVREPMFLLLVGCGTLYLMLGEPREALLLLGFVFVVMGITIVQERRTERALEALRDLSSPRALVIRDGQRRRIAGREVVRGDLVVLAEGDRVPADGILRRGTGLSVDESLLTGESAPVRKEPSPAARELSRPGGDDLPAVFSGTLVTAGSGLAEILATGARTEIGRIGRALQKLEPEQTLLQRETGRLVRALALAGLLLCLLVVVVYALTRGGSLEAWQRGVLAGLTLAMATLPEESPVVLTIFLAMGAWRISRSRVLTRRMPAIETLGAATVLCVDKTGTLTQNRMTISKLVLAPGDVFEPTTATAALPEEFHQLLEFGILASRRDPFDPMEQAFVDLGARFLEGTEHLHEPWLLEREYPLSRELLAVSHVWRDPDSGSLEVAAKGAPEAVADLCHLPPARMAELAPQVRALGRDGYRVLAVARGVAPPRPLPSGQHDFNFELLGFVALADPIRPSVPQAVRECHEAGIRVVMITGDYPATAESIGRQIGLTDAHALITGPELDRMSDAELAAGVQDVQIFARVVPEQKLRIVQALKAAGEVVAMTGDGVNDAPALKAAHIGVAMGGRGTDVARESASLVLLDDDFSSIVEAVRLGRRIFDNIRKAIIYIMAIHVPIAGLSLVPVFFGDWPLILLPIHIVFLELIIDPSCTMIFEAEQAEPDIMKRPPRGRNEHLFGTRAVSVSVMQGLVVLAVVLGVFLWARHAGRSDDAARGMTFVSLVVANVALILVNRSWHRTGLAMLRVPNRTVWLVTGGAALFLTLAQVVGPVRAMFRFAPPRGDDMLLALVAGALTVAWFELLKLIRPLHRQR